MDEQVKVVKLNTGGEETWSYSGKVLQRTSHTILLEAEFNRDDFPFEEIVLKRGDRFIELFFDDRWYNIFTIFDKSTGAIKAWYCNVTRPAVFVNGQIRYTDLALDLLVYPDGRRVALDLDEFDQLDLDEDTSESAWRALAELESLFAVLPSGVMPAGLVNNFTD